MNKRKLYLLLFLSAIILSSCFSVAHETVSNQPKMAIKDAMDVIKGSIKDTIQNPYFAEQKAVSDVVLSKDDFTLIHPDGTKKHYSYNDIINPVVVHETIHNLYFIKFNNQSKADAVLFNHKKSATMFADALYFLKHYNDPDVKKEREREHEDCLSKVRTPRLT